MNKIPLNYNALNALTVCKSPNTVHSSNTDLTAFFRRYLFNKLLGVYRWELPEVWNRDYFMYTLFGYGFISVLNVPQYGTICQQCGLMGFDIYYQPIKAIITNPAFTSTIYRDIGIDTVILHMMYDYTSPCDIIEYYAERMAIISETADINIFNSKLSYVFLCEDKVEAESFKKMYDKVSSGDPAAFIDKSIMGKDNIRLLINEVGKNYIAGALLDDLRKIENEFNTLIGIPSSTDKRERLIESEMKANTAEQAVLCDLWLENLKNGVDKANEMFDLNIKVSKKFNGGGNNARNLINDRFV